MKRLIDLTKTSKGIVLYPESGIAIYHKWDNLEGIPKYVGKKLLMTPDDFTEKSTGVIIDCEDFIRTYSSFHIKVNFDKLKGKSAIYYQIVNNKNEIILIICPF